MLCRKQGPGKKILCVLRLDAEVLPAAKDTRRSSEANGCL
jgi:hypothetical protein